MKVIQTLSVQFPIPAKSDRDADWAGWKRALQILWKDSRSKSWGLQPVAVTLRMEADAIYPAVSVKVMEILEQEGVLMNWKENVREWRVVRVNRRSPLNRVVVEIERRKG